MSSPSGCAYNIASLLRTYRGPGYQYNYTHTGFVPGRTEEMMAAAAAATPLKRAVEADDVAKAVMACVTHLTHTTGSIVRVDSGSLL